MRDILANLFVSDGFAPHGFCLLWDPALVWLHAAADALITVSYYTIPIGLVFFAHKRRDLAFRSIFLLFGIFIVACGTSHLISILTLWLPVYWLEGLVKAVTAVVSLASAVAVWQVMPAALKLPSNAQLEDANRRLSEEFRKQTLATAQIQELNATLEERITERTTELAAAKAEAEAANQAKSLLLANVSHELRTPLNAILGFSEVIAKQILGPVGTPRYQEYAGDIHTSGKHLLALINELLDLAKIEAGHCRLEVETVSLDELVRSCVALLRHQADAKGIVLSNAATGSDIFASVDPTVIRQVIINLLYNALKFTQEGGRIEVLIAAETSGDVRLEVVDNGVGVDAAAAEKIFEPFETGGSANGHEARGAGLGLTISRRLMEQHGGSLELAESAPGIGSRFVARLPRCRVRSVGQASPKAAPRRRIFYQTP
jgi:signal transduction histidine kinase